MIYFLGKTEPNRTKPLKWFEKTEPIHNSATCESNC